MSKEESAKKYPFIRIYYGDGHYSEDSTVLDLMPRGWKIAFGEQMCADLEKAMKASGVNPEKADIHDIKEKWGRLDMYVTPLTEEIEKVTEKYSDLAKCTCINCGKIGVPMINFGWISPVCRDCYNDDVVRGTEPYDKLIMTTYAVPEEFK